MNKIELELLPRAKGEDAVVRLVNIDRSLIGKKVELRLDLEVQSKIQGKKIKPENSTRRQHTEHFPLQGDNPDLRIPGVEVFAFAEIQGGKIKPAQSTRRLHTEYFQLQGEGQEWRIHAGHFSASFGYLGKQIDLYPIIRLVVNKTIVGECKVEAEHMLVQHERLRILGADGLHLLKPEDKYDFSVAVAAVRPEYKLVILFLFVLSVLGALLAYHLDIGPHGNNMTRAGIAIAGAILPILVIVARLLVGFEAWSRIGIYCLYLLLFMFLGLKQIDGEILEYTIKGAGLPCFILDFMLARLFRDFSQLAMKKCPPLRRGTNVRLSDLVEGKAQVPLRDIVVRVVAWNSECGNYEDHSGTSMSTVSFSTPIQAVKLLEYRIPYLPAEKPIGPYLKADVDFTPMFADLLPPVMIDTSGGISVSWEVQFLHPEYSDHILAGDASSLNYRDFLDG